jgi:hypothetical protein
MNCRRKDHPEKAKNGGENVSSWWEILLVVDHKKF